MIKFKNLNNLKPYSTFKKKYDQALNAGQRNIEAISISSFDKSLNEVDSRYVNIKFVDNDRFIFFTNYESPKAIAFESHDQIAGLFFWPSINTQVRIKARIEKTSKEYNNEYFKQRSIEKNALAISSRQSRLISSYRKVKDNYKETKNNQTLTSCPDYWGGYFFIPYYFEFWEGHDSRLNKRQIYDFKKGKWANYYLQP